MENIKQLKVTLEFVKVSEKEILRNLLEKYEYEFSQYTGDAFNELGLFGYNYLDYYWVEENRWPYFIKINDKLAGFVLVNDYSLEGTSTDFTLSEFFVAYPYRGKGVAEIATRKIFENHVGTWGLLYHPDNVRAKKFWHKVVGDLTDGNYEQYASEEACYSNAPGQVLLFESK